MRKEIKCGKDFESSNAVAIENFLGIWEYIKKNQLRFQKTRGLCDNRESFLKMWGKPNFRWVGGSGNHQFHVWIKSFNGCQLVILTAKRKGTSYEIVPDDNEMEWYYKEQEYEKDIIAWFEELIKTKDMQLK